MSGKNNWFRNSPFYPITVLVTVMWVAFFAQHLLPITQFGIVPRTQEGLIGIVFSPFLHGHRAHLIANTIGIITVGFLYFSLVGEKKLWKVTIPIYLLSGLFTWCLGRGHTIHIGMSGFLYGMMGYLFFVGLFQRNFKNIFFSVLAILLYGGAWVGLLPNSQGISWEAHLGGLVAGLLMARKR